MESGMTTRLPAVAGMAHEALSQPGLKLPAGNLDEAAARTAAKDFEAMFLTQMLKPMFEGIKTDGPFGGGQSEEIYRSLMVQEYGRVLSEQGGIGLADNITREILRMQEAAN